MMPVYLDNNATTPLDARVLEAMLPWLQGAHGNASSVHQAGRYARAALDTARQQVAELVNAHPSQVIFTSGGTEANNMIIKGTAAYYSAGTVAVSAIEHASVLTAADSLKRWGWQVQSLTVDADGIVCRPLALAADARLVSVMMANNETGVLQPVTEIAEQVRQLGALMHTDASQAAGKMPVDFRASGAHFMTLSAHKFYGPQGIGAVIMDKAQELQPLLHGGGQEKGLRGGTENIAAIVGFGCAAALAKAELVERTAHCQQLRQALEAQLQQISGVQILAETAPRLANTVMMTVQGFRGETVLMGLDRKGIAASSGSACHSEHVEPSHVLLAMGITPDAALSAIRISLGKQNTVADVDQLVAALTQLIAGVPQVALAS